MTSPGELAGKLIDWAEQPMPTPNASLSVRQAIAERDTPAG